MLPLYPSLLPYPTEMLEVALITALVLLADQWEWLRTAMRRVPARDVYWLAGWCVLGLVLRLHGGVRVPGWINNHGYEYLNTVLNSDLDGVEFHGNGNYALHRLALIVLPSNETAVLAVQLVCSVLTIPTIYAVSRLWLGTRDGALASAAIAAVLPSFVFYAMTEERLVGGTFFLLVALVAVGIAVRERGFKTWIAAGALGAFAASFQPFLLIFPFAVALLLLSNADGRRALSSSASWCAFAVFLFLSVDTIFLALSNISLNRGPSTMAVSALRAPWKAFVPTANLQGDAAGNTFAHADFTPPPFLWLAVASVLAGIARRAHLPLLAVAVIVAVLTIIGAVPSRMNSARLQLPAHAFYTLLAGDGLGLCSAGLRTLVPAAPVLAGGALVVIASVAVWSGPIGMDFAPQLERRVALDGRGVVSRGCEILIPAIPGARGPDYLTPTVPWRVVSDQSLPSDAACFVYFRPARCFDVQDGPAAAERTDGLRADCAAIERRLALTPLFVRLVAARADYSQRYLKDQIELGYFRVQMPRADGGRS